MKITRVDKSYDLYRLEASHTELSAIKRCLSGEERGGVITDEILKALEWYLERLPAPGEEEEPEAPARDEDETRPIPAEDEPDETPSEPTAPKTAPAGVDSEIAADFDLDLTQGPDLDNELPQP